MAAKLNAAAITRSLRELGRVAEAMVDGELAVRIVSDRSAHYIAHPHPKYRFMTGDYYDVDHASFLLMKKTLLRLEKLAPVPCNSALWVRVKGAKDVITPVVQNGRLHRYYSFGESGRKLEGDLARCMKSGQLFVAPAAGSDYLTVLAPVRDSLGDVVGCVELTAANPKSRRLAPAWS